jgi:hypothetical protein
MKHSAGVCENAGLSNRAHKSAKSKGNRKMPLEQQLLTISETLQEWREQIEKSTAYEFL